MLTCVHNQNNIAICVCMALFRPSGNNCQRAFELTFALCSKHDYFICIRAGLYPLYVPRLGVTALAIRESKCVLLLIM